MLKDILKWFGEYGKIIILRLRNLMDCSLSITVGYQIWNHTVSNFQIVNDGNKYTLNISVKNVTIPVAG